MKTHSQRRCITVYHTTPFRATCGQWIQGTGNTIREAALACAVNLFGGDVTAADIELEDNNHCNGFKESTTLFNARVKVKQ